MSKGYRVKFRFWRSMGAPYYHTEWFDTVEQAKAFVLHCDFAGALNLIQIEDQDGNVI